MFTPIRRHLGDTDPIILPIDEKSLKDLDLAKAKTIEILVKKPNGEEVTWRVEKANLEPPSVTYKPSKKDLCDAGKYQLAVEIHWIKKKEKDDTVDDEFILYPIDSFVLEVR